jgi:hypothetical protein
MPDGPGQYKKIAEWLNEREIRTNRGGIWTAENVRKEIKRKKLNSE